MLFFISFFFSFVLLINRHFSQFMNDHQIIHTHFLFLAGANVMAIEYKQTKVKAKYVLMSKTPQADGNRYMLSFQNICTCSNACKDFFFFCKYNNSCWTCEHCRKHVCMHTFIFVRSKNTY